MSGLTRIEQVAWIIAPEWMGPDVRGRGYTDETIRLERAQALQKAADIVALDSPERDVARRAWELCDDTEGTVFSDEFGEHYRVPKENWDRLAEAVEANDLAGRLALSPPLLSSVDLNISPARDHDPDTFAATPQARAMGDL